MNAITNFTIDIKPHDLLDLHQRLSNTRWPDEINNSGWEYGTDLAYLRHICEYWQKDFDWRKQEKNLNELHHYRTSIDGFGLHFVHHKGSGERSVPLLLTHGFPDNFIRFLKIIPLLTTPDENGLSFDVVIPSIPGYGFSDRPAVGGMNPRKIAGLFVGLMERLGYSQFLAHGGDWGSSITEQLALHHPDSLLGIHLTDIPHKRIFSVDPEELTAEEKNYVQQGQEWSQREGAYAMIQSTKPQTLSYGINDSPAGLAGWILELFRAWSDCGGYLENRFTRDELLTNISIYWFTQTANSAFRLYSESARSQDDDLADKVTVPTAGAIFPKDIVSAPLSFAKRFYNVVQWNEMPKGGHFAALEEPELLVNDIREFSRKLGSDLST